MGRGGQSRQSESEEYRENVIGDNEKMDIAAPFPEYSTPYPGQPDRCPFM